jgi:hypothetical protein
MLWLVSEPSFAVEKAMCYIFLCVCVCVCVEVPGRVVCMCIRTCSFAYQEYNAHAQYCISTDGGRATVGTQRYFGIIIIIIIIIY